MRCNSPSPPGSISRQRDNSLSKHAHSPSVVLRASRAHHIMVCCACEVERTRRCYVAGSRRPVDPARRDGTRSIQIAESTARPSPRKLHVGTGAPSRALHPEALRARLDLSRSVECRRRQPALFPVDGERTRSSFGREEEGASIKILPLRAL